MVIDALNDLEAFIRSAERGEALDDLQIQSARESLAKVRYEVETPIQRTIRLAQEAIGQQFEQILGRFARDPYDERTVIESVMVAKRTLERTAEFIQQAGRETLDKTPIHTHLADTNEGTTH